MWPGVAGFMCYPDLQYIVLHVSSTHLWGTSTIAAKEQCRRTYHRPGRGCASQSKYNGWLRAGWKFTWTKWEKAGRLPIRPLKPAERHLFSCCWHLHPMTCSIFLQVRWWSFLGLWVCLYSPLFFLLFLFVYGSSATCVVVLRFRLNSLCLLKFVLIVFLLF